ncbi:cell division protein FtsB [Arsukibacterium sp. MJ3]|jgi:cell division protein FtsB|uniref:cell division protein FtsB n=1 Tax=Arsukibacterium sp. MJ3 TaxID=1632859 RepID=UPI0006273F15|nr:cell division protein FtsB [Arsukibacterium sp. MJ3]KKO48666.1 cell division protein FtsB [Arsukibacterium sp. MJ3]
MQLLRATLLILFCLLQYRLWFGQFSVTDYLQRLDEIATQRASNQELQKRNRLLIADVTDLQQGLDAIEERARNELGLIGEDEVFFRMVQTESQQDAAKGKP